MLTAFAILTDGLVYAAYLFVVAIGLTLIFGVMKILNVTHGSFYAFGAFGAASAVGVYFEKGWPVAGGFLLMVLVAMAIGLVLGLIIERGLLRQVYGRDEVIVVLVTFSTFLILEDMILLIWGTRSYPLYQPLAAAGSFDVGALVLSGYDMGLIGLAVALAAGAHWALKYTRYGRLLTAVIFDRETAAAFGINVTVVFTATFVHWRHAGRTGRRCHGAENIGHARHRRGGDRARICGRRHRWHGLDRGRAHRGDHRRAVPRRSGAPRSATRAVRHLCGDGAGAHFPAARPVHPGRPEKDLT